MRTSSLFFIVLLGICGVAEAQQSALPKWDAAATAGWMQAQPEEREFAYGDDWYGAGRYAAQIGYYWTEHLKTEVEYALSAEGSIYRMEFRSPTESPAQYPTSVESFHRVEQLSARIGWQFGHNSWVHPYVIAGIAGERDRRHHYVPPQYQSTGPNGAPAVVTPAINSDPTWDYRIGVTAAAGAKAYISPRAFVNTGIVTTWSRPARTVTLFAGFGFDL